MITSSITLSAGQTVKFSDLGNFVRILAAEAPVTIRTYKDGQVLTESAGVLSGYAEQFDLSKPFDAIEIYSATAQTVQVVLRLGQVVYYDQAPTGAANIVAQVPPQATGSNTAATVTNASGLLLAQNSNRQYLLIQNKDTTGSIYINFGATATIANGVQIEPLGSFELNSNILTAAIYAIGDIASNANVVIVSA